MSTAVAHKPLRIDVRIKDGGDIAATMTTTADVCVPGAACWPRHAPGAVARQLASAWADDNGRTLAHVTHHGARDFYVAHLEREVGR